MGELTHFLICQCLLDRTAESSVAMTFGGTIMHSWRQRILMLGAALMMASAAIVTFGVIPLVRGRAVPAFWANVLFVLLAVVAAVASSRLGSTRATLRRALASVSGFVALVLGLLLIDAASAFSGHGLGMNGVVVALWVCVCLDVLAGIGIIGSAFVRQAD
jgi:hypothetical protein